MSRKYSRHVASALRDLLHPDGRKVNCCQFKHAILMIFIIFTTIDCKGEEVGEISKELRVQWDGNIFGVTAYLQYKGDRIGRIDDIKIPDRSLVESLNGDTWVTAHVILTLRHGAETLSGEDYNGLPVQFGGGRQAIDSSVRKDVKERWITRLKIKIVQVDDKVETR